MKDILSALDPRIHRNYFRLRKAVKEPWASITEPEAKGLER